MAKIRLFTYLYAIACQDFSEIELQEFQDEMWTLSPPQTWPETMGNAIPKGVPSEAEVARAKRTAIEWLESLSRSAAECYSGLASRELDQGLDELASLLDDGPSEACPAHWTDRVEPAFSRLIEREVVVESSVDKRDRWMYYRAKEGIAWSSILDNLAKMKRTWPEIKTIQGVKAAIRRYAIRHKLKPISTRRAGRPKNQSNSSDFL
jgi:hypothetical protein